MNLRCKAYEFIIKGIGIIWPEPRYLNPGTVVSPKTEQRYYITGMAVQNRPEYSFWAHQVSTSIPFGRFWHSLICSAHCWIRICCAIRLVCVAITLPPGYRQSKKLSTQLFWLYSFGRFIMTWANVWEKVLGVYRLRKSYTWEGFIEMLTQAYPLAKPRIYVSIYG